MRGCRGSLSESCPLTLLLSGTSQLPSLLALYAPSYWLAEYSLAEGWLGAFTGVENSEGTDEYRLVLERMKNEEQCTRGAAVQGREEKNHRVR